LDFTLWNPVVKVTFGIGDLLLGIKIKLFLWISMNLNVLFLWYLSDLDLWLSAMSCGVMSTITSVYTYSKKNVDKITSQLGLPPLKYVKLNRSTLS
jgi:hypothetical protein